nr:hypothetical protein GCM10020092_022920 [Actinoplanes digitatis]
MTLSLHRGRGGEVDAVEIYRPEQDVTVLFRDIPLFDLPEGRLSDRVQVRGRCTGRAERR